mgnify:CR=1 FL=1|jgi:transcriptional regulator with XRE-family HTH domain|tara:strand:+ start:488 stop:712 length:225 start_codon:yes stop_codon:yes gene_type:complete
MLLEDYRTLNNMTYQQLADFLEISHATEALRYCKGIRFPRPEVFIKIQIKTKHAVTANDFVAKYRELHEQEVQP